MTPLLTERSLDALPDVNKMNYQKVYMQASKQNTQPVESTTRSTAAPQAPAFDFKAWMGAVGKEAIANLNRNVMAEYEADQLKVQQAQAAKL